MKQADNTAPNPTSLTSAALRHRIRAALNASVSDVWALVGRHERLPEYAAGIASVEILEARGAPRIRVCHFRSPDVAVPGPVLREQIQWEAANVGYATTVEPGNTFGLTNSLSLVRVQPTPEGTLLTWEEYYDNPDLPAARASYDDGLADIAERLIARFGGRVLERYVDGPRS